MVRVVALVQIPTSILAARNARTMSQEVRVDRGFLAGEGHPPHTALGQARDYLLHHLGQRHLPADLRGGHEAVGAADFLDYMARGCCSP